MQKRAFAAIFIILLALASIFYGRHAEAATTRFSIMGFRPTYDRSPFFGVRQSQNLEFLGFHFGTALDYSYKPLQVTVGATRPNLVKTLVTEHFYGTFGISDWLEFSADLPVVWHNRFTDPDTLGAASTQRGIGDLQIEIKARILDNENYPVGIAVAPFITVPTGDMQEFIGNDGATGGGKLVIDTVIADRYTLALNVGGVGRKEFNAYGMKLGNQFLLDFGAAAKIVKGISVSGEVDSSTTFSDFFSQKNSTSVELRAGIKWDIGKTGFTLGASGGGGLIYGAGSPKYRALGTLAYTFSPGSKKRRSKIDHEKIRADVEKTLYFPLNSSKLTAEAREKLDKVVPILDENSWITKTSIDGYCDSSGPKQYNRVLSERRAKTVYDYMKNKGVDESRMRYEGHEELPALYPLSRQRLNRKVEISLPKI